jgi:PilZ domain
VNEWEKAVELRKECRYPLSLKVVFVWADENGVQQRAEGITRDISTKGAFIYAAVAPPEKALIRMGLDLAPLREGTVRLRINVKGRIVRIEEYVKDPVHNGFAVLSESTVLRESEKTQER